MSATFLLVREYDSRVLRDTSRFSEPFVIGVSENDDVNR
jgi:hypothetical protein